MKRKNIGRVAGVAAASLALGAMAQSALAAAPACGPGNDAHTFTSNESKAIPDNNATGISTSLTVTGETGVLRDVDLRTSIAHTYNQDISISLTHETASGSKTVQLIKQAPANRSGSNGFNGTRWDDSAAMTVSEATKPAPNALDNAGPVAALVPEGALGAFVGDDPNGKWTVTVTDTLVGDIGSLNSWSLDLGTSAPPAASAQQFNGGQAVHAPDHTDLGPKTFNADLTVSGAQAYLTDLNLRTDIEHHLDPGELKVWLTSPAGTKAMISNGRGTGSLTALTTSWDDAATDLITQVPWVSQQRRNSMVPEGAMAAFIGENPNGVWRLTIEDANLPAVDNPATPDVDESLDTQQYGFDLNSWGLDVGSAAGCDPASGGTPPPPPPAPPAPPVIPAPVQSAPSTGGAVALPAPACVRVKFATRILGAKKVKRGKRGVIKVRVKNTSSAASARGATATFAIPSGFTVAKKPSGAKVRKGKVTLRLGTIGARKTKTVKLTLKARGRTKIGLKKRTVSIKAACGSKGSAKMAVRIR